MATPFIVVASVPRRTRRLGRGVQLGDADTPAVLDGTQLLAVVPMGDQETVVPLDAGPRQASEPRFRAASFYRVATTGYPVTLQWTRLEAGSGHAHVDLAVAARLRVVDAAAFLQTVARARCGDGVPLSADLIASWLAETMRPRLLEELRRYSLDVLLQKNPLPDRWWQRALEERLSPHGLAVDGVGNVHWSSPDAEAARMAEERRRHLASVETLQQVEREAALARTRMEAAFERKLKELELDTVRQQELEVRQKKELAAVELEWERLRRAAEVEALEHERRLAELQRDTAEAARVRERQARAEAVSEARVNAFDRLATLPTEVWRDLTGADPATRHASAERLVTEHGIGASLLAWLGLSVSNQLLLEHVRDRALADGRQVAVEKPDLQTRTIGTRVVQAVPVNASLQLHVSSRRAGFLTLLNLGTSGHLVLHVPNAYIRPRQARVEAGRRYDVPGPELLPWDSLRSAGLDYLEMGPPGWEHMLAIVSDEPLIDEALLIAANPTDPLVEVDLDWLFDALGQREPDSWSPGVLSFLAG
jgi:hypothetical protein